MNFCDIFVTSRRDAVDALDAIKIVQLPKREFTCRDIFRADLGRLHIAGSTFTSIFQSTRYANESEKTRPITRQQAYPSIKQRHRLHARFGCARTTSKQREAPNGAGKGGKPRRRGSKLLLNHIRAASYQLTSTREEEIACSNQFRLHSYHMLPTFHYHSIRAFNLRSRK
jgi:hypothetical protein